MKTQNILFSFMLSLSLAACAKKPVAETETESSTSSTSETGSTSGTETGTDTGTETGSTGEADKSVAPVAPESIQPPGAGDDLPADPAKMKL